MPSVATLAVFSGAALLLLVVPGPAVTYVVARSASQGRVAGLVSVAGLHTGTLVHVAAAVAGLSALMVASATAFTVVKLAGALYLVHLGVGAIRRALRESTARPSGPVPSRSLKRVYVDGIVLNVLNPKTAVFFLAFVPQFVHPDAGATTSQLVVLGLWFVVLGLLSDGAYAVAGAWAGDRLRQRRAAASPRSPRVAGILTGTTYVGLGVVTAVAGPNRA